MNPYLAIALAGLALKIWAGYRLHQHWRFGADRIWLLAFLATSYLQTAVEVSAYLIFNAPSSSENFTPVMHAYYFLVTTTILIFPFSVATVIRKSIHPLLVVFAAFILALFTYLLLNTALIVEGYERLHYIATRVPGDYYWIFQTMAILTMLLCPTILIQRYRDTTDEIIRIKSANLLIGFLPLGITLTSIIIVMQLGAEFNAAGILPLLISIYIVVLVENLRDDRLLDLRAYLPWTEKARLLRRLAAPMRQAGLNHAEVRELAEVYRRTLERQNRQVRLSRAAETPSAAPLHEFDPAAAKPASRR